MKTAQLTLISKNQNSYSKAEKLADLVSEILTVKNLFKISKYEKFVDSYKLEIVIKIGSAENSIVESIEKTDMLCSPWLVKFNRSDKEVELMFNKSDDSNFSREEFNVIAWGNWQLEM